MFNAFVLNLTSIQKSP